MIDNTRNFIKIIPSIEWPPLLINRIQEKTKKFKFLTVKLNEPYLLDLQGIDIFSIFDQKDIELLQSANNTYFFFDYLKEGTSYKWVNYYKLITDSAIKYNIPFNKIIFASSNLLEQQSYEEWCQETDQIDRFKIFILNFWDGVFHDFMSREITIDQTVNYLRRSQLKDFLFLNRRKRPYRLLSIFQLYQSAAFNKGLISCDKITEQDFIDIDWHVKKIYNFSINKEIWNSLAEKTPLILDFSNFKVNWASTMPDNLFRKTLFSLVNETLIEEHWINSGHSLFYSEKTFKPMLYNHPILIFGQAGANQKLKSLGYKSYDNYFNLNFDSELNTLDRINSIVSEVNSVCNTLNFLSLEAKIEWLLQDRKTLEHNKEVMKAQDYNFNQTTKLFDLLKQEIS
jgi:hypothetical protein